MVLEDEGAFGDEEGVFGSLIGLVCVWVMGGFEPGVFLIAVLLDLWVIEDL